MGYRIDYDKGTERFEVTRDSSWRRFIMSAVFFALFLLLCSLFWPEGSAFIQDVLIPGDDAVTIRAFMNLTEELRNGTGLKESVTAFCRDILVHESSLH